MIHDGSAGATSGVASSRIPDDVVRVNWRNWATLQTAPEVELNPKPKSYKI
ncbi:MAG: hypothetical protein WC568_10810 [Candidatus Methanoperedens sp.]